jgi:hypothetical protein
MDFEKPKNPAEENKNEIGSEESEIKDTKKTPEEREKEANKSFSGYFKIISDQLPK